MLLKQQRDREDYIHFEGMGNILSKIISHYYSCVSLIESNLNKNISRAANRFIKIEKSMIDEILATFNYGDPDNIDIQQPVLIHTYRDMYQSNSKLIHFLKSNMKKLNNQHLSSFLSYWVAALQVENDEMGKHL